MTNKGNSGETSIRCNMESKMNELDLHASIIARSLKQCQIKKQVAESYILGTI